MTEEKKAIQKEQAPPSPADIAVARAYNINSALVRDVGKLDAIAAQFSPEALAELPPMQRGLVQAKGMQLMKAAMTVELVEFFLIPLQGTALGFLTDKDSSGGYPAEALRVPACEAFLRGLRPTNNEFNVIAGKCYATVNGLERKVREWTGLANLEMMPGDPLEAGKKALVPYTARWLLHGRPMELLCLEQTVDGNKMDARIPVRLNAGMTVDAILGKAKRKMYARILEKLTGVRLPEADADDDGVINAEGVSSEETATAPRGDTSEDLFARHAGKVPGAKPPASQAPPTDPAEDFPR